MISDNGGNVSNPAVAADVQGNVLAVWEQTQGPGIVIVAARWSSDQHTWGTPKVISKTDGFATRPHVALDPTGNAIAVWQQAARLAGPASIWFARYLVDAGWADASQIPGALAPAGPPRVALDGGGRGFAVWSQNRALVMAYRFE
jgi:hypothetical protein